MKNKLIISLLLLPLYYHSNAQLGVNTYTPDDKSIMDIRSWPGKGGGVLMPRMDTETRRIMLVGGNADIISIGQAQNSMLVYDTTQNQYYFYNPTIETVGSTVQSLGAGFPDYTAYGATEDAQRGWQVMSPFRTQYIQKTIIDPVLGNQTIQTRNIVLDTLYADGNVGIGFTDLTEVPLYRLHIKGDGYFDTNLKVEQTAEATKVLADTVGTTGKTLLRGYGACPIGTILMWNLPGPFETPTQNQLESEGWKLCDGNGTYEYNGNTYPIPDLTARFVVGLKPSLYKGAANTPYNVTDQTENYELIGNTGGENNHQLLESEMPSHNHGGTTNKDGAHQHNYLDEYRGHAFKRKHDSDQSHWSARDWVSTKERTTYDDDLSAHQHVINNDGGDQAHENRPPYYVVAYIIRVK